MTKINRLAHSPLTTSGKRAAEHDRRAQASIDALLAQGDAARPHLDAMRQSDNPDTRRIALLVLARQGDVGAREELARDYTEYTGGALGTAAWLISCGPEAIRTLCRCAPYNDDLESEAIVHALVDARHMTTGVLLGLAEDCAGHARFFALHALSKVRSLRAEPFYERVYTDRAEDDQLRAFAIAGLAKLGRKDVVQELVDMMLDDSQDGVVQTACLWAVNELDRDELKSLIANGLHDRHDPAMRAFARWAIQKLRS